MFGLTTVQVEARHHASTTVRAIGEADGPHPLPGTSSIRLSFYGTLIRLGSALMVFPLAAESLFGPWYGITLLCLAFGGTASGIGVAIWSGRKSRQEIAAGYTPYVAIASTHPELFWVDAYLTVYRAPGEATKIHPPRATTGTATSGNLPSANADNPGLRRCTSAGCPAYFDEVRTRRCPSCGNPTQRLPDRT